MADVLSKIPLNGNEETTQNSACQQEIVLEINDKEEIPEGNFPKILKLIKTYQQL